ncbi:MAG: hypothetical protein JRJ58_15755 [Deltaproteobacteria bacterium]|nr:hypothetical protein [Deltaproteobacteria bacterium]
MYIRTSGSDLLATLCFVESRNVLRQSLLIIREELVGTKQLERFLLSPDEVVPRRVEYICIGAIRAGLERRSRRREATQNKPCGTEYDD